ncbi:MAG: aconitate hydratase AcnA [Chloroflexi bacterium]|nr:aconitate hydratase AcnA [Chloroflexota bacterium]
MSTGSHAFGARATLNGPQGPLTYYRLGALAEAGLTRLDRLPNTVKILLESVLRHCGGEAATEDHVRALAGWDPKGPSFPEFPYMPARVLLQDLTGVPAIVDLAVLREAMKDNGGDPARINPLLPADLVTDHSVQVDYFGTNLAFAANVDREYERNRERYALLRWFQNAFGSVTVVPPGTGIVHQVNLEYLSKVVQVRDFNGQLTAYPDSCVGLDSHTTMTNGLGVLSWGVGGIEAEAAMLGQPIYMLKPAVIGVKLTGQLREGATATDLVLTVTQMLRQYGVVGRFVEFCGAGLSSLAIADRATIANMSPEYGATASLFPVDDEALRYLRLTGREDSAEIVERYTKEQGLFHTDASPAPVFDDLLELDLGTVESSMAGPRRPHDRVPLSKVKETFRAAFSDRYSDGQPVIGPAAGRSVATLAPSKVEVEVAGEVGEMTHGSVVIAAITSCTNTSNPSVMLGAGLLARKAVERGLRTKPHVKTSLAPGSRAVTDYYKNAGLQPYLDALGFQTVGYGCTTCIGNSGPLPESVSEAIKEHDLVVSAVLSGNRNFEGRIHAQVRAAWLASPILVVAYAIAGTVDIDLTNDPIAEDRNGQPVYLREIWPSQQEVTDAVAQAVTPELFKKAYSTVFAGDEHWRALSIPGGALWSWDPASTYIRKAPYFDDFTKQPRPLQDIENARVLVMLGDSITTDHISPAGSIAVDSPAGRYLQAHGVQPRDFNQYGARRGNHEVMWRGTFANIRLRNELAPGREGNWTTHQPDGQEMSIYDASLQYAKDGVPLIAIGGSEWGQGSSRDWAAKGPMLLGIKAVLVESFERIHRSNLIMMGVLPLTFQPGQTRKTLGLTGREQYTIHGIADGLTPDKELTVQLTRENGEKTSFQVTCRIDSPMELEYYRHGGILQMVIRRMLGNNA